MAYSPNVDYRAVARRKAAKYGLDPSIFERQIGVESIGYSPAVISGRQSSPAGAQGIAQFMPATARGLGVDPLRPVKALDAAAKLMAGYVHQYGNYRDALIAYNAGPGRVGGALPAETQNYVAQILRGHDPGHLSTPARQTSSIPARQASAGVSNPVGVAQPGGTGIADLIGQLTGQHQAPSISLPSFAQMAGPTYPKGFAPSVSSSPVAPKTDIGSLLSEVQSTATAATAAAPSAGAPPAAAAPRGQVGKTLVVGDSLEVGTLPELKKLLGGRVSGNAVGGRPSSHGVDVLRKLIQTGNYQNVVFDLGTNDASVGELRQSLASLTKIAGDKHIVVSTVNSPWQENLKNRLLRTYAANHPNVTLVRWHGASRGGAILPDGIHGAYGKRAALIAQALGYQPQQQQAPAGGVPKGFKPGSPVLGLAPHAATHQTDGLPGYPAYDYMAPAGSLAVAPVTGTVFKLSGHNPAAGPPDGPHGPFGWSVYIRGTDGRLYYLTHLGSRTVRVGQRIQAGQKIGTVGNYAKWGGADHIHMGVHGA